MAQSSHYTEPSSRPRPRPHKESRKQQDTPTHRVGLGLGLDVSSSIESVHFQRSTSPVTCNPLLTEFQSTSKQFDSEHSRPKHEYLSTSDRSDEPPSRLSRPSSNNRISRDKHLVEEKHASSHSSTDMQYSEADVQGVDNYRSPKPKPRPKHIKNRKEKQMKSVALGLGLDLSSLRPTSRASRTSRGSRPKPTVISESESTAAGYQDTIRESEVCILGLLEGLPIQHVTRDEWEQVGVLELPDQPTSVPLSIGSKPIIYGEQGGKYKEIIPTNLPASSAVHKRFITIMKTPIELAIAVQKWFIALYTICQGFLGGLALAHFILAYSAGGSHIDVTDFIRVYATFAKPYQAIFYFLALLCMMSTLDKCDLRGIQDLYKLLRFQPLALLILIVYSVTLVLTCHTSYWDHRLSVAVHNGTLWEDPQAVETQLGTWKTLSLLRCVGGILGWLLASLSPCCDGINSQLNDIQELQINQASQSY